MEDNPLTLSLPGRPFGTPRTMKTNNFTEESLTLEPSLPNTGDVDGSPLDDSAEEAVSMID